MKTLAHALTWSVLSLGILIGLYTPVQAQLTDQTVSNLGDVLVRFCNENAQGVAGEMKSLFLETQSGEENEICLYINNSGPTDVNVLLNFVDGTVTADDSQNKACQPEGTTSNFGQYVEYNTDVITVPAGSTVETRANATFPDGYSGLSYGCVTMRFADDETATDEEKMFNVLTRRGYFIDFLVDGDFDLGLEVQDPTTEFESLGDSEKFVVYKTDMGIYKAALTLFNPGNIAQEVTVTPTLSALLADPVVGKYVVEQTIVNNTIQENTTLSRGDATGALPITKKILPNQGVTFEFELTEALPRRNGPITLDAQLTHVPVLDFVNAELPAELQEVTTMQFSTSFFVMPWLPVGGVAVLILLVLIFGFKDNKKDQSDA